VPAGDLENLRPALGGQGDAGGVVVVRDRVQQLDRASLPLQRGERLLQRGRDQPVLVERYVDDVRLVGTEHPQRPHVAGRLRDDDVTRVDEDSRHKVEGLLAAGGDDDVVRVRVDALEPHDVEDLLAQRLVALAGPVLQRHGATGRDDALGHLRQDVERQPGQVRHAAGEGDDLRAVGDREQRPDLRRAHRVRPVGVGVQPGIQPGAVGR
jgi:hypothetical protein